uniref:Uncharacterized protein n=1 Tax=Romanomermis culicivorax TaxID=13658 RepID=A0A915L1I5_ROMCU
MANFKYAVQNKFQPMKDAIYNLNTFIHENKHQFIMSIEQTAQDFLLPIELSTLKNILNLVLQHKFGEAALESVNYLGFQKNAVPQE